MHYFVDKDLVLHELINIDPCNQWGGTEPKYFKVGISNGMHVAGNYGSKSNF